MAPKRLQFFGSLGAAFLFLLASSVFAFTGPSSEAGVGGGAIYVDGSGRIGVGTTNPAALLHLGFVSSTAPELRMTYDGSNNYFSQKFIDGSTFSLGHTGSAFLTILSSGKIGIGTTTPASALSVAGATRTSSGFYGNGANVTSLDPANTIGGPFSSANYAFPLSLGVGTSTTSLLPQALSVYGSGYIWGSLGIGTTNPATQLQLNNISGEYNSNAYSAANITLQTPDYNSDAKFNGLRFTNTSHNREALFGVIQTAQNSGSFVFQGYDATAGVYKEYARIDNRGNIGVGTTTPPYKLSVEGPIYATGSSTASAFCLGGNCQTSWTNIGQWTNTTGGIYYEGKVGVGTQTLSYPLYVSTSSDSLFAIQRTGATYPTIFKQGADGVLVVNNANTDTLTLKNGNVGIGTADPSRLTEIYTSGDYQYPLRISKGTGVGGIEIGTNSWYNSIRTFEAGNGYMSFNVATGGGTSIEALRLLNTGNVGIGTTNPLNKLVTSGRDTTSDLDLPTVTDASLQVSNSDTAYGTFFGSLPSGRGLIQQRRQDSATYYDLNLQPYGGNVGIGTTAPGMKLDVYSSTTGDGLRVYNTLGANTYIATVLSGSNTGTVTGQPYEGKIFSSNNNVLAIGTQDNTPLKLFTNNTVKMTILQDGNVGIATTTPSYGLTVVGTGSFSQPVIVGTPTANSHAVNKGYLDSALVGISSSSQWTPTSTGIFYDSGNVGIRTKMPGSPLEVQWSGAYTVPTSNPIIQWARPGGAVKGALGYDETNTKLYLGSVTAHKLSLRTGDADRVTIDTSGNVGIGTTTPASKLQIEGDLSFDTTTGDKFIKRKIGSSWYNTIGFTTGDITITGSQGVSLSSSGYGEMAKFDSNGGSYVKGNQWTNPVTFYTKAGSGQTSDIFQVRASDDSKLMVVQSGGNVGISSSTPGYKLSVEGTGYFAQPVIVGTPTANNHAVTKGYLDSAFAGFSTSSQWTPTSTGIFYDSGSVGIGTVSPGEKLEVKATAADSYIKINSTQSALKSGIKLRQSTNYGFDIYHKDAATHGLYFDSVVNGVNSTVMMIGRLDSASPGNVGIGTSTPSAKLQIAGTSDIVQLSVKANGTQTNNLQEWYNSSGKLVGKVDANGGMRFNISSAANFGTEGNYNFRGDNGLVIKSTETFSDGSGFQILPPHWDNGYPARFIAMSNAGYSFENLTTAGSYGVNFFWKGTDLVNPVMSLINTSGYGGFDSALTNLYLYNGKVLAGGIGIASSTPGYPLTVVGAGYFSQPVIVGAPTANNHAVTKGYLDSALIGISSSSQWSATSTGIFYNGGNVGVGTVNPAYKLQVTGGIYQEGTGSTSYFDGDVRFGGPSGAYSTVIKNGGNVGIGTSTPSTKLEIVGDYVDPKGQLYISGSPGQSAWMGLNAGATNSTGIFFRTAGAGSWSIGRSANETTLKFNDASANNVLVLKQGGNVGIATTTPSYTLDVVGTGQFSQPVIVGAPTANSHATTKSYVDGLFVNPIFTGSASFSSLTVSGTTTLNGNIAANGPFISNVNMNGNNITGVNKLTVSTIDPVYTIGGQKYATYVSDSIGIKVVTSGKGSASTNSAYVIDFKKATKGSDEWLFWQTIREGNNMADVTVLLTPEGTNAALWYELKPNVGQVLIHSSKTTKFSYQLSAPRHDANEWGNTTDTNEKGISLPLR